MRSTTIAATALSFLSLPWPALSHRNHSTSSLLQTDFSAFRDDRPPECPPCPSRFNCNLESDKCLQVGECNSYNGKCACPSGFGDDDCSKPLCGSLPDGQERPPRPEGETCTCPDGWEGINCNVCKTDRACERLMPKDDDGDYLPGVCYKEPGVIKQNYQFCDVTNVKIIDILDGQKPQVTFSCTADDMTCGFQFWVDQIESFYCGLTNCTWTSDNEEMRNKTTYTCDKVECACIPERFLCGKDGSVDLTEFLDKSIQGPGVFSSVTTEGGSKEDGSSFEEPAMNDLISSIFGDRAIFLRCDSGECLAPTEVPGYERPIAKINTPLIAGIIAGCALFLVAVGLLMWYLSRRSLSYGPIYLDDSDDESSRLMTDHKPASLQFSNVAYSLNGKQILAGVHGNAQPGQVMAIMGSSGAGKTTFLDILARKNKRGTVVGEFYVNGERVPDTEYRNVTGFVDQEDTLLPTLTVHETILTSALLRLPRDMARTAKEQRVIEVEKQLGIYAIRDQLIGSEEGKGRGISGGEKRRVGIACELVTSPSILFLDEPTSGLDAFNAFNVIECLVTLARTYNRTVIFTIHQPRSNIVALFDQLVLLARGKTVYSGPFSRCQDYFDSIGYSCPAGFNIADYLVDLTMHVSEEPSAIPPAREETDSRTADARTIASSVRAMKSVASNSVISRENSAYGSPSDSLLRPKGVRRPSLKQQQDKKLFSRRTSQIQTPDTVRTEEEEDLADSRDANAQWLRLSKQNAPPPQIPDDPHQLPPMANEQPSDLDLLISAYANSDVSLSMREEVASAVRNATNANGAPNGQPNGAAKFGTMTSYRRISYTRQFIILSLRTWRNIYRNPQLMLAHYAIAILVAVMSGYLFYGLTADITGFQNRLGLLFFTLALFGFGTLTSLTTFSNERLLFVRERAKGYYSPFTYYVSKVVFDIVPLRLIPPIILAVIVYPMTGLVPKWPEFFCFVLVLILFNLAASIVCLFIGIVVREGGLANLIGSLYMLFSLLFGGFLLSSGYMPTIGKWLQQISIFHYGFEALIVNEVRYLDLIDHKYGLDIEVPGATILSSFGFHVLDFWRDVVGLCVISAGGLVCAYLAIHFLLVERR